MLDYLISDYPYELKESKMEYFYNFINKISCDNNLRKNILDNIYYNVDIEKIIKYLNELLNIKLDKGYDSA